MKFDKKSSINLVWDVVNEPLTIGGALVLRQEAEILARLHNVSAFTLHLIAPESSRQAAVDMAQTIFGTSSYPCYLVEAGMGASVWPPIAVRAKPDFSYFTYSRIITLHAQTGLKPRLQWSQAQLESALQTRRRFPGRLYCVHLRSVAPFDPEESNADGPAWDAFFQRYATAGKCNFLLIGDDPLPFGLNIRPGLIRAANSNLDLDLASQLALISMCDGFLGMASGLCTAANFSDTPHVIFKHPVHHIAEMARELGSSHAFAFAGERQQLWRREATAGLLDEAFHLISS